MDDLRCTIDTKSDQLNADDLIGINRIIRVTDVQVKPGRDRPLWISFNGDNGKPYKPNITMRKLLIFAWSSNRIDWIGRSMELYNDPEVKFGLQKVGGIKISRVSHISKEIKAMLQTTRGKRTEFVVGCLPNYPEKEFTEKSPGWIAAIKAGKIDIETVIEKTAVIGIITESQIEILKGALEDVN